MFAVFIFEIKDAKNDKICKVLFLRNGWPYGYDFWHVFRGDLCEASKNYNFGVFLQDLTKNYDNLNAKSCLKFNGPKQKDGPRWRRQIICT